MESLPSYVFHRCHDLAHAERPVNEEERENQKLKRRKQRTAVKEVQPTRMRLLTIEFYSINAPMNRAAGATRQVHRPVLSISMTCSLGGLEMKRKSQLRLIKYQMLSLALHHVQGTDVMQLPACDSFNLIDGLDVDLL